MSGRIGLKPWERRSVMRISYLSVMSLCWAVALGWLVFGLYWVLLAYGVGAVLAWAALRADGARLERGASGSPLRRVLGRVAGWEIRAVALLAGLYASFQIAGGFLFVPLEPLKGLWDPEVTKAEIADAFVEGIRQIPAATDPWVMAAGISGMAAALFSGLSDWMWLLALARRRGMSPWQVLSSGWSRSWLREASRRERSRRRRLLRGEG